MNAGEWMVVLCFLRSNISQHESFLSDFCSRALEAILNLMLSASSFKGEEVLSLVLVLGLWVDTLGYLTCFLVISTNCYACIEICFRMHCYK